MMPPAGLDPAIQLTLRLALALLLLAAAHHKLRGFAGFRSAVRGYRLLPEWGVAPAAAGLVAAECGIAGALLVPAAGPGAPLAAAALLALYTAAVAINLARGRSGIDCGCGGPGRRRDLGAGILARNAALVAAALACALPAGPREIVWVDGVTICAGLLASALLYAAIDVALAHAPRLERRGG